MKKTIIALVAGTIALTISAQSSNLEPMHNEKGLFGYGNKEKNEFTIKPQWDEVKPFNQNGIAIVRKDAKFGLINTSGAFVGAKMGYSIIAPYDGTDLWLVALGGKRVDNAGKISTRVNLSPFGFKGSLSYPIDGAKWGLMKTDGSYVIQPIYQEISNIGDKGEIIVKEKNKLGVIDINGKVIHASIYDAMTPFNNQGIAAFRNAKTQLWAILSNTGHTIIPESSDKYTQIFNQYEGNEMGTPNCVTVDSLLKNQELWRAPGRLMPIVTFSNSWISTPHPYIIGKKTFKQKNKWVSEVVVYDIDGKVIIPASARILTTNVPSEGIALVGRENEMGFWDIEKGTFTPVEYRSYMPFKNGRSLCFDPKELKDFYLVDANGKRVSEKFDKMILDGDRYIVQRGDNFGLCDIQGTEIIPPDCKKIFSASHNLYGIADNSGAFGYVSRSGETAIPLTYADGSAFINGFAAVSKKIEGEVKKKSGVIDLQNNVVVPFNYDKTVISPLGSDKVNVWVKNDGNFSMLDITSGNLTPTQYVDMNVKNFGTVTKNAGGKLGLIVNSQEVIPPSIDDEDVLLTLYKFMIDNNIAALTSTEARKLSVRLNNSRNKFKITDKIADSFWDF